MTILHKIISSTGIMTVTKVKNIKNRARPRGQSTCAFFYILYLKRIQILDFLSPIIQLSIISNFV